MISQISIILFVLVSLSCSISFAQDSKLQMFDRFPDDEPRTLELYTLVYEGGANMSVPQHALRKADVERWADVLGASPSQLHFMTVMHAQFVDRHNSYLDNEAPGYFTLSRELNDIWSTKDITSPDYARLARRVDEANARVRRQLTQIEHDYIDLIAAILTDAQRERLIILRYEATRRNCRTFSSHARWVNVEMREIWNASTARDLVTPTVRRQVDDLLLGYEIRLTSLICARADLEFAHRDQLIAYHTAREAGSITRAERTAWYGRIMRTRRDADRRIRLLHEFEHAQIVASLPESASAVFVDDVKRTVFPELYPDRASLHGLLAELTTADLPIRQADAVNAISTEYLRAYEQYCRELEAICIEWGEAISESNQSYHPQRPPETLRRTLEERRELSRKYMTLLLDDLGAGVLEAHIDLIPAGLGESDPPTAIPEEKPAR